MEKERVPRGERGPSGVVRGRPHRSPSYYNFAPLSFKLWAGRPGTYAAATAGLCGIYVTLIRLVVFIEEDTVHR